MVSTITNKIKWIRDYLSTWHILNRENRYLLRAYRKFDDREILLLCHALEKGMGITNVKAGYGVEKAETLLELLEGKNDFNYALNEALSVLNKYLEYQRGNNIDISILEAKFTKLCETKKYNATAAGYSIFDKEYFLQGGNVDFEKLVKTKHSLRKMSQTPIDKKVVEKAIELAARCPSACNRQPYKVYYSLDLQKNSELSKLVPGNKAFASEIPYYCVITVDRRLFMPGESFQWFVNGGIFVSYFTLALHSLGIASCIFQWPILCDEESKLRELINADMNEEIITIIGYGRYPDEAKCICAERKPVEELLTKF